MRMTKEMIASMIDDSKLGHILGSQSKMYSSNTDEDQQEQRRSESMEEFNG